MDVQASLRGGTRPSADDDPKALLSALTSRDGLEGTTNLVSEARKIWDDSTISGFALWSRRLRDQIKSDIVALRASGKIGSLPVLKTSLDQRYTLKYPLEGSIVTSLQTSTPPHF